MDGLGSDEKAALAEYLSRQRWFAGKGRDFVIGDRHRLTWLSPPASATPGEPGVRVELIQVRYDDGTAETYQMPIEYRELPSEHLAHAYIGQLRPDVSAEPAFAYDALHDKDVTGVWLSALLSERELPDQYFHRIGRPDVSPDEPSLVLTAEQSNTSLAFGSATLFKVFRRVEHGRNPDIEIHEALTRAGGRNIADLHGWVEATWPDESGLPGGGDLGMFSEFFRTAGGGWELAIVSVRDLFAEADLHADEVGGDFAGESERLGATTAEVHADLATHLQTASWGRAELARMAAGMRDRLTAAVAAVPALERYAKALATGFEEVEQLSDPVPVQRVHGDLHLGQTMRTVGGWRVIDFEGEPAKSLADRIELDSPLRDVAGMLRSFDYAAWHLLVGRDAELTVIPVDERQLTYRAQEWAIRNREAFCAGYASVASFDPRDLPILLRAYETDKAIYEVVYEARTRPGWIGIPMGAIERLCSPAS